MDPGGRREAQHRPGGPNLFFLSIMTTTQSQSNRNIPKEREKPSIPPTGKLLLANPRLINTAGNLPWQERNRLNPLNVERASAQAHTLYPIKRSTRGKKLHIKTIQGSRRDVREIIRRHIRVGILMSSHLMHQKKRQKRKNASHGPRHSAVNQTLQYFK